MARVIILRSNRRDCPRPIKKRQQVESTKTKKKISTTFEGISHPSPMLKKKKKPKATPSRRHHITDTTRRQPPTSSRQSLQLNEGLTFMEPEVPPPGTKWPGEANGQVLKLINQRSPSARRPFARSLRVDHSQDGSEEGSTRRQKTQRTTRELPT